MRNEIIDVEFREIETLESKKTEELAAEANTLWEQMEAIGNVGLMLAAQAGRRLLVIKDRCPHGEFENWCDENLKFSTRKANRMMKLAKKMNDENSFFSNPSTLSDIGISKVWELLAAPEDVAEEVVNNPEMQDASVREFKEEIARLKAEKEQEREVHKASIEEFANTEQTLRMRINELVADLESHKSEEQSVDPELLAEKEKELEEVREQLAKEKEKARTAKKNAEEKAQKEKDKVLEEQNQKIEEAIQKAKEEAEKKFEEESKLIRESNEQATLEINRLQHRLENASNTEVAIFKVKSDQFQADFNACLDSISDVAEKDSEKAAKMKAALKSLIGMMDAQL